MGSTHQGSPVSKPLFWNWRNHPFPNGLAACLARGATEIVVFPYFLAAGTHVAHDIPEAIQAFQAAHPQIKVSLTRHLGDSDLLPQAILQVASAA